MKSKYNGIITKKSAYDDDSESGDEYDIAQKRSIFQELIPKLLSSSLSKEEIEMNLDIIWNDGYGVGYRDGHNKGWDH